MRTQTHTTIPTETQDDDITSDPRALQGILITRAGVELLDRLNAERLHQLGDSIDDALGVGAPPATNATG